MRQELDLPRVVCKYEDVFPDELPRLPPHKDVDFIIELHPGTSPISMTDECLKHSGYTRVCLTFLALFYI